MFVRPQRSVLQMASLKDIRIRIGSVKSTRKITSAMKVVSAAKFHKAQEQTVQFQRYLDKYRDTMAIAMSICGNVSHPLMTIKNEGAPVALLVLASNSSLCGGYNANIVDYAQRQVADLKAAGAQVELFALGKKAADGVKNLKPVFIDEALVDRPSFGLTEELFQRLSEAFDEGKYSRVLVCYNRFHSAALQTPTCETLLPCIPPSSSAAVKHEYIFEPDAPSFFGYTLSHFVRLQLYTCLLNNYVGEHGARMTAMSQATDNANTLVDELTLEYNKARQAAITNEILEIVSGASALEG